MKREFNFEDDIEIMNLTYHMEHLKNQENTKNDYLSNFKEQEKIFGKEIFRK